MVRIGLDELADGAAQQPLLDDQGVPVQALVVVDNADTSATTAAAAAAAARSSPRILVGIHHPNGSAELAAACDLVLHRRPDGRSSDYRLGGGVAVDDMDEELARLDDAVRRSPRAALVLAGLLPWSETLSVGDALDAESLAYSTLLAGPEFRRWLDARGPLPPPPTVTDPVLIARQRDVLRITLNRPARRNAYGRQVRDGLVAALELALLDDSIRHVVLDGAGPCFCSGGDLAEFGKTPDVVTAHLVRTHTGAGALLHRLVDRAGVIVHGPCVGAGVELPAFAKRVVARAGTTFRLPEIAMGLVPGAGGTVSLPRRIGRARTLYLCLSGAELDVSTALAWGLVDELG